MVAPKNADNPPSSIEVRMIMTEDKRDFCTYIATELMKLESALKNQQNTLVTRQHRLKHLVNDAQMFRTSLKDVSDVLDAINDIIVRRDTLRKTITAYAEIIGVHPWQAHEFVQIAAAEEHEKWLKAQAKQWHEEQKGLLNSRS